MCFKFLEEFDVLVRASWSCLNLISFPLYHLYIQVFVLVRASWSCVTLISLPSYHLYIQVFVFDYSFLQLSIHDFTSFVCFVYSQVFVLVWSSWNCLNLNSLPPHHLHIFKYSCWWELPEAVLIWFHFLLITCKFKYIWTSFSKRCLRGVFLGSTASTGHIWISIL